mmetsp:Transcript_10111/g.24096  ORF Transcript_10111/g.24096 Transcript_10111/m.24096 type:complete len:380 (+) Transcript_10111:383-1522(+)
MTFERYPTTCEEGRATETRGTAMVNARGVRGERAFKCCRTRNCHRGSRHTHTPPFRARPQTTVGQAGGRRRTPRPLRAGGCPPADPSAPPQLTPSATCPGEKPSQSQRGGRAGSGSAWRPHQLPPQPAGPRPRPLNRGGGLGDARALPPPCVCSLAPPSGCAGERAGGEAEPARGGGARLCLVEGARYVVEQEQRHKDRLAPGEPKARKQVVRVADEGEEGELDEHDHLRHQEEEGRVPELPVPELVRQHRDDLARLALLAEGVVEDDALVVEEAVHVRVGVRGAPGAVHHVQLPERELQRACQLLDGGLELTLLQRLKLVEQWRNSHRVDGHHEEAQPAGEHPQVKSNVGARDLQDFRNSSDDGRDEHRSERDRLELI